MFSDEGCSLEVDLISISSIISLLPRVLPERVFAPLVSQVSDIFSFFPLACVRDVFISGALTGSRTISWFSGATPKVHMH